MTNTCTTLVKILWKKESATTTTLMHINENRNAQGSSIGCVLKNPYTAPYVLHIHTSTDYNN